MRVTSGGAERKGWLGESGRPVAESEGLLCLSTSAAKSQSLFTDSPCCTTWLGLGFGL